MKILRTYIGRLLLLIIMLSGSVHVTAQIPNPILPSSPCAQPGCQDAIYIGNQNTPGFTVPSDTYSSEIILHSDGKVDGTSTVDYKSNYVRLDIGFSTEVGADFSAEIEACIETDTGGGGGNPAPDCPDNLEVTNVSTPGPTIAPNLYQAGISLESDGTVAVSDIVRQKAGHHVTLKPGFKALRGSVFRGYIEDCSGLSEATYYVNDASQLGDIYTSAPGSDATGNGTAARPFATLKHVIQTKVLTGGDIIYIDTGIYDDTFVEINNPVNNLIIRGAGAYNTIFDNNYTDNNIEADNVSTGNLFMRIYTNGILLEGFTIREYNYLDLDANVKGLDGKAISVKGAECVVFDGVNIIENAAGSNNGFSLSSMFIHSGSVDVLNSSVSYNQSPIDGIEGGGIDIYELDGVSANVNIINSVISNNIRSDRPGGGMMISGDHNVYIDNTSISNNVGKTLGGAINMPGLGDLNINNSCISNNVVIAEGASSANGGGINVRNARGLNLYNTVFDGNIAQGTNGCGGGICSTTAVKMELCKFEDNQAENGNHIQVGFRLDVNETQFLPETDAIFIASQTDAYIQNSGTPETSSPITFINNNPPQNYATPACDNTIDCVADAGFDQTICTGESVQIGTEPQDGLSYTWVSADGLNNPNISNPTASPSETTTYTVYLSGCSRGSQDEVTIYVSDDITFPANQVTCSGANVPLVVHGGAEYQWSPAGGLSCIDCPNPIANVTQTTTYAITVTDENGCEATGAVTITIAGTLAVTITSDDTDGIICPGQEVQLTAQGAMDYTWSATSGGFSNPNIANPIVTPTETTTYTVVGFQDECMSESEITLTLAEEYDVAIIVDTIDMCTIELEASNTGLNAYQWVIDDELVSTDAEYNHGVTHNGTYNICLTVTGICGKEVTTCENVSIDGCICLDADIFDCPEHSVNIGHPCDDNNANTYGDMYMDDCVCRGVDCSLVEITNVNDPPLPSAIYYGTLNYDGREVTDYLIEWRDENDDVVFTSAAGIYYNPLFHESHPPMTNIPVAAGIYTPIVVQSSLPGVLECTLQSYTINNYTCTGEDNRIDYEGPPGVIRNTEIDWTTVDSDCGLYLDFEDYDLPDYLEVIGIDANGGETSLYGPRSNRFEDIITIQNTYESIIIRVTSNTDDGDNTEWDLDFSCCTEVCCSATFDLTVTESLTECGNCEIYVGRNVINPDGCMTTSVGYIDFEDEADCTVQSSYFSCNNTVAPATVAVSSGQVEFQFTSMIDYDDFEARFTKLNTGEAAEYRFNLKSDICQNDGDKRTIIVTHLDVVSLDPSNKKITVTYEEYDSCACVHYSYFASNIVNLHDSAAYTHDFSSIYNERIRVFAETTVSYGPFTTGMYQRSPGCGRLDEKQVELSIQDQNCPCQSWILKQDTNEDGTYDTVVEEAAGWSGTCSQP